MMSFHCNIQDILFKYAFKCEWQGIFSDIATNAVMFFLIAQSFDEGVQWLISGPFPLRC